MIGLIAAVVTAGNTLLLGLPLSPGLILAACAGAALVYWADRVLGFSPEDQHAHPDRVAWIQQHRRWLSLEGAALALMLVASLSLLTGTTIAVAALCGGLGAVHVFPILPGQRRMKSIGWGRTVTIALAWSVGSVLLPWVEAGGGMGHGSSRFGGAVVGLLLAQTLVVYANVVVAGWVDRQGEEQAGVPVDTDRSGADVRRCAVSAAVVGGGLVLAVGATILPTTHVISYVAGAFGLAVLLARLRPQDDPHHMLWLDLAVALPGALVLLLDMGLRIWN